MTRAHVYSDAFVEIGLAKALLLEARPDLEAACASAPTSRGAAPDLSAALSTIEAARAALGSALAGIALALGSFVSEANAAAVNVVSSNLAELIEAIRSVDKALNAVNGARAVSVLRTRSPLAAQALAEVAAAAAMLDRTRKFVTISVLPSDRRRRAVLSGAPRRS